MFSLYKNGKILLNATYWEDLVSFVEIMKQYNKRFINRKDYVVKCNNDVIYSWRRNKL